MNIKNNLILVDTSYTVYYRYFATLRWLSLCHKEIYNIHIKDVEYNWQENELFIEKYEQLFIKDISKLLGNEIYLNSTIIYCMDMPNNQLWRTDIKPDYKKERINLSKKTNYQPTFIYTYDIIIPKILTNNNIFKLRIDKLEADDIIGIISKYLEKTVPDLNIYIISGDKDFYQLGRKNLYFINFTNKKLIEMNKNEARLYLHKKILLGDKSDYIKSIFPPKFSTSIKKKLINSISECKQYLKTNEEIKNKYKENNILINFKKIPKEYKVIVITQFKQLFI